MIDLPFVLLGILVLFVSMLVFRSTANFKLCALCGAVSLTWVLLLVAHYVGYAVDPVLIGILMGGSSVGTLYLLEQKLPERYQIFKVPFFLTLVVLAYAVLGGSIGWTVGVVMGASWAVFLAVYAVRHTKKLGEVAKHIITCCKNW